MNATGCTRQFCRFLASLFAGCLSAANLFQADNACLNNRRELTDPGESEADSRTCRELLAPGY
jgi:hypothetical protein